MLPPFTFANTPRLQLRPLVMQEARELLLVVMASRESLGRYMSWPREMVELDHARRFVKMGREQWLAGRTVRLGVFERESGALVGNVELDGVDSRRRQAELGYWVRSDREGNGYAGEAARSMLRYAFDTLRLHKVRADVAVGNSASVARRRSASGGVSWGSAARRWQQASQPLVQGQSARSWRIE